jgi:geranylgeranyl diphosphate synthase type II
MELAEYLDSKIRLIDKALDDLLPPEDEEPSTVHRSMRYTALLPGKRLRPVIMLAIGEMFKADIRAILGTGCAIEMIHSSSLILDDLPCMDDAAIRRGKKTNHLEFGEETAILAAFNLLNLAFQTVAGMGERFDVSLKMIVEIERQLNLAVGSQGLIGGQALDLEGEGKKLTFKQLEFIHSRKTGALFTSAGNIACILSGAGGKDNTAIELYTRNLGLAFQVFDDILDTTSTPEILGKDTDKDSDKTTFVSFSTLTEAEQVGEDLIDFSIQALDKFGKRAEKLIQIAQYVMERKK